MSFTEMYVWFISGLPRVLLTSTLKKCLLQIYYINLIRAKGENQSITRYHLKPNKNRNSEFLNTNHGTKMKMTNEKRKNKDARGCIFSYSFWKVMPSRRIWQQK